MAKKAASASAIAQMGFTIRYLSGENALVLMPGARPNPNAFKKEMEAEQNLGSNGFASQATTDRLAALDKEGRVLWGWSPWRAKEKSLTWAQWDAFCERWLGGVIVSPNRTAVFEKASWRSLFEEIDALQTAGRLKVVCPWPTGYKREDEEEKPKAKKRRRGKAIDDVDEEPETEEGEY